MARTKQLSKKSELWRKQDYYLRLFVGRSEGIQLLRLFSNVPWSIAKVIKEKLYPEPQHEHKREQEATIETTALVFDDTAKKFKVIATATIPEVSWTPTTLLGSWLGELDETYHELARIALRGEGFSVLSESNILEEKEYVVRNEKGEMHATIILVQSNDVPDMIKITTAWKKLNRYQKWYLMNGVPSSENDFRAI